MNPRLYVRPAALLLVALASSACSDAEGPDGAAAAEADVFALADAERRAWLPPTDDDWLGRWIAHLRTGSKEGQRFALARLREEGVGAGPVLALEIRAIALDPSRFGYLVSLLAALGASGDAAQAPVLAEILRTHPTPVVRTQAAEAAASLRAPELLPTLRDAIARESESAPRRSMLIAVARIGGPDAVEYLENRARAWVTEAGLDGISADNGDSWNALMLVEGDELLPALLRLDALLPPPLRVQALTARVEMGDRTVGPALREYLDAEEFPSAKTRTLALTALADLRDWPPVLAAAADPDLAVRRAVARLLGLPAAVEDGVGADLLDGWLADADEELRNAALAGLLARGQRHRLDPLLQTVREFPLRQGSAEALLLLTTKEFQDPRLPGILLRCWEQAEGAHRMDVLRALTKLQAPEGPELMARALADDGEDLDVRRLAAALIANFDACIEPLITWYAAEPSAARAVDLIGGLGRRAESPRAREALLAVAADPAAPDAARKIVLDAMPLMFGFEAVALLLELREREPRGDVRAYHDALLNRWF
jgi:hypothetical protein